MKFNVYCMRDQITGYQTPTFELNDAAAIRNFSYAIKQPNTLLFASAKDFDLMKIGEFDTETGIIDPITPTLLIQGNSVVKGEK